MKKIITGNLDEKVASHPETRGWFLGSFMEQYPEFLSDEVEMKWVRHPKGERKPGLSTKTSAKTFVILLEGSFLIRFTHPEQTVALKKQGDFVFYDTSQTDHEAVALDDCLLLVVRYPSRRNM